MGSHGGPAVAVAIIIRPASQVPFQFIGFGLAVLAHRMTRIGTAG
jgi:hypothetical protein